MFTSRMQTEATPERVFALCKLVESKGTATRADLQELMEPEFLGNSSKYFGSYCNTAVELGLLTVSDNNISLAVGRETIADTESMRKYVNATLAKFYDGPFARFTRAFFAKDRQVLSMTDLDTMVREVGTEAGGIDANGIRAWRFWASFLGLIRIHNVNRVITFLPNAATFLADAVDASHLELGVPYKMSELMDRIGATVSIACNLEKTPLNYGVSCGFRTLHDIGKIKLEHVLDQEDIWTLDPLPGHLLASGTVTNVTILR